MTSKTNGGAPLPMAGIRVLDVSNYIAGPYCCTQLGEFGAEVIKVEMPKVGDPLRNFGTRTECGETLPWLSEGRNKKCVTLNLKSPEGAAMLRQLAAKADVVVENFRPGVMEGWGLSYEELNKDNPGLIMVRISGYGQTGPYKNRPGFGRIANAFGGISFLAGFPDRPPVTPGSATLADYMAGLYGSLGVMFALRVRDATGQGQMIDIGLYEAVFRILDELAPAYDYKKYVRQRMGPTTVNVCPHSHYLTGDERWVAIACTTDKIFTRLAVIMGEPEVAGEGKYGTFKKRWDNREEVDAWVTVWTRSQTRDEVLAACDKGEVPAGPVYAIDEIFEDPQYAARENMIEMTDPRIGSIKIPNAMPRMSLTPAQIHSLGPSLGAHNAEIYRDLLGLSEERLKELADKGVV
ncbi:MAG: CoA transferase [Proteobacteria bacterium]|nr:CoA transferase [Pseudomonadota bacterium]